jgi:altronate dehydratase large subunit
VSVRGSSRWLGSGQFRIQPSEFAKLAILLFTTDVLARRGATPEIHDQIIRVCEDYEKHLLAAGQDCRAGQPTPGNKAGGLSTIDEKSLGCIRKGGTRPIVEVLEQAQPPTKRGAIVMDTAGYDISSVTSMAAAGCQVIIFTTGRGTPTGNAIVPVLKVTANEHTYSWMEDNMDVDLSGIIRGEQTIEESGGMLLERLHEIANGKLTKAEAYGFSDIAVDHVCRFV